MATPADEVNRLAVAAPATLFTHAGAGHQVKLNKANAGDTASLLMQSNFSGRAEIGLADNDDLSLKLSADGSTFADALVLSAGRASRLRLSQPDTSSDLLLAEAAGSWQSGGADYAEFFEWSDGNPTGAARPGETPIGVISSAPAILGDAGRGEWCGKYAQDPFGARLYDLAPDSTRKPRLSPDFDPNMPYSPRAHRPEWAMVGLLGKLVLRKTNPQIRAGAD